MKHSQWALFVHLVKDKTITSCTSPKSQVKIIKCINIDNRFNLIITVVFAMITQFGELVTKSKEPVTFFLIKEGETIPQLHLRYLQYQCKMFIFKNKIGQIEKPNSKIHHINIKI